MELLYKQTIAVKPEDVNSEGRLKLSALLQYAQQVSGGHSDALGFDWNTLASQDLFWAVLRHRVEIRRLPNAGETVYLETWPIPATRSAYPRAVRAMDSQGNVLFETVSLWVLMHLSNRQMVLPGKSGVDVPGIVRGDELAMPGSIPTFDHQDQLLWQVGTQDLDLNGHVNNAKYLDRVEDLLRDTTPRELTICYLSEALLGQEITLGVNYVQEGKILVDGFRRKTDVHDKTERVFAVSLLV